MGNQTILDEVAVVLTTYNEARLLPIWLTYYGRQVGYENLYILDDGSTDGSTDDLGPVQVIRMEREPIDQIRRSIRVSCFHTQLLQHYRAAIYTDVDEFLVVDPMMGLGLRDYVLEHVEGHVNALGFNILQNWPQEGDYEPSLPLLAQRQYAQFSRAYCKQLIHTHSVRWQPGFHLTNAPFALGTGLYLFHTRAFDRTTSITRITNRNRLAWSENAVKRRHGWQNRLEADAYLREFHGTTQEQFAGALPASRFNSAVIAMVTMTSNNPEEHHGPVAALEQPVLTLPERFRQSIPAVEEPPRAAYRSPSLPSGKDLFDAAMEKAGPLIAHNERVKPTS